MSEPSGDSQKQTSTNPINKDDELQSRSIETETTGIEDWQIQRDEHKKSADQAFRVGGYKTAIDHYTKAISLDPEFVVLHSNRSAAFLANGETSKALRDARACVELETSFLKGHSRLAAALLALKRFEQAKDSYEYVLKKDPTNLAATKGIDVCVKEITKRMTLEEQKRRDEEAQRQKITERTEQVAKQQDEGDEDDLLNDFFDEVEEVVAKKKDAAESKTNAIRNDRETLGTTEEQIERLLQPRYEWRNLNPYYVLQLTAATATDDDISRRYKALSLLLHPDKNRSKLLTEAERDQAQLAYDQVQSAKIILADADRKRYTKSLVEEGMKQGEIRWKKEQHGHQHKVGNDSINTLKLLQERDVMRLFAQVEQKRREVEERERKFEQRERQQEDDQIEKERRERKFDKQWRDGNRVDKRVGNWRNFETNKKRKP